MAFSCSSSYRAQWPDTDDDLAGSILTSLPESCLDLELNVESLAIVRDRETSHVCQNLWKALPRLRHVRLQTNCICPEFCGPAFELDGSLEKKIEPRVYLRLESLIINCLPDFVGPVDCHGTGLSIVPLMTSLRELAAHGHFQK